MDQTKKLGDWTFYLKHEITGEEIIRSYNQIKKFVNKCDSLAEKSCHHKQNNEIQDENENVQEIERTEKDQDAPNTQILNDQRRMSKRQKFMPVRYGFNEVVKD